LDQTMLKSSGRSQETPSTFQMIDENQAMTGNSEPSLNRGTSSLLSVQQATMDRGSASSKRLNRLVLSPPSLHMSFDVDNHPWPPQNPSLVEKPLSKSTDNMMHRLYPCANSEDMQHLLNRSNVEQSTSPTQQRHTGHRQQFEIAQISAGYMRTSGAIGQFKVSWWTSYFLEGYKGLHVILLCTFCMFTFMQCFFVSNGKNAFSYLHYAFDCSYKVQVFHDSILVF
jgi:hypothetical protein